jgi:hypothetical protein
VSAAPADAKILLVHELDARTVRGPHHLPDRGDRLAALEAELARLTAQAADLGAKDRLLRLDDLLAYRRFDD